MGEPVNINDPKLLNRESFELLCELYPNANFFLGDVIMAKHEYGGINIPDNKGAFAIGENNTVNQQVNNDQLLEVTNQLLEAMKQGNFPEDKKKELKEIIEATADTANQEKLNKPILKSLLGSANAVIDTVTKTPGLITAYDKWSQFIQGLIS